MPRRLVGAIAAVALLATLSACALPLPFPKPIGGGVVVEETVEPGTPLEALSCLRSIQGRVADAADLVACDGAHRADVVALVEFPGIDALLAEHTPRQVWDELSGNYAIEGLSVEYDAWAADACRDALREAAGWDGHRIGGRDGADLDLLPASASENVEALADFDTFSGGDHRTRCVVSWFEAIGYGEGVTIADVAGPRFPSDARDCYLADDEGYMEPVYCDTQHTDQVMLTVDAVDVFGVEKVGLLAEADERVQLEGDRFCEDAVLAVLGGWDEDRYWVWGATLASDHWAALGSAGADPAGYYPLGCTLSSYTGELVVGDAFAEYGAGDSV